MSFARACAVSDIEPGKPLAVTVEDVRLALVRDSDEIYAIYDECSHAEIPLSEGDVDGCLIECWMHGSTFDLRTGKPKTLPAFEPVAIYPVTVDGDDVLVDVASSLNGVQPD
jgi:3-phenylpropionate/trans-cinnamate dioxygenase ferredoxin component